MLRATRAPCPPRRSATRLLEPELPPGLAGVIGRVEQHQTNLLAREHGGVPAYSRDELAGPSETQRKPRWDRPHMVLPHGVGEADEVVLERHDLVAGQYVGLSRASSSGRRQDPLDDIIDVDRLDAASSPLAKTKD